MPAHTDSLKSKSKPSIIDASYRSQTGFHKVIVQANEHELRDTLLAEGGKVIADYESFMLMKVPVAASDKAVTQAAMAAKVRDDLNVILLRAGAFDTTAPEPQALTVLGDAEPAGEQLYLVQMIGPVKDEWVDVLQANAEILSYIPNNAYLVRADATAIERMNAFKSESGFIQWSGAFKPAYKIAPEIALDSEEEITVTVQMARNQKARPDVQKVASMSGGSLIGEPVDVMDFTNVKMRVRPSQLAEIARMSDVVWIEQWNEPVQFDERQGQILAGNFSGTTLNEPGYLSWLNSKGITSEPDFIVDLADSGIDQGNLDPEVLHRDFLNESGLSRVVYARQLGTILIDELTNDITGHGTLDASIVGGFNSGTAFPAVDDLGYAFGLGVHPYAKLGVTKIFGPNFTNPNLIEMVSMMYQDGARISSNSWGSYNNSYTAESQLYDRFVRDATPLEPGNQELAIVFASGNRGQNFLSVPANAKNVITVGASEGLRPGTDGCQLPTEAANDPLAVISFSSGGFTNDGRLKPDILAPGTHIQGVSSQDPGNFGSGICGPKFFPDGQTLYTWSSGTSHAAPAVSGAAALVRQFFKQTADRTPSPAMLKAFLANTTTYMTSTNANDDLPSTSQGWGLLNIGRALDDVPKVLVDQTQLVTQTGQTVTIRGAVADSTKPFRVTLAWTDAPGTPAGSSVVNNLDLQVEVGGNTYNGNAFVKGVSVTAGATDQLNNLESVWLPQGVSGNFVIRVTGVNIAGDGVPGNQDATDQDFALVVYNGRAEGDTGGGPTDFPPQILITHPLGGEELMVGNLLRITWQATDDNGIESQRVEFSTDGVIFDTIAMLDGNARQFDWKIPAFPTTTGRIRVTALDGKNLPVSSVSPGDFEVIVGPPDTTPPTVTLLTLSKNATIGGGLPSEIKWTENDNVGVIQRVIELSTDNGRTFEQLGLIIAPSSGEDQTFTWQVPASLSTDKGKVRVRVLDGAGNSAAATSTGQIEVWPTPIITDIQTVGTGKKLKLEVFGRNFRMDQTEVFANGKKMKKILFNEKCDSETGLCKKVTSNDKKVNKLVPEGKFTNFIIKLTKTGQNSPEFRWKRKKPKTDSQ
jgi:hypothetical protein